MAAAVTLSSVGVSAALPVDYIGAKTTTVALTLTSTTMSVDATLQATLDDPARIASPVWFNQSSIHYSSTIADTGAMITIFSPVAALRLASTAISSGSVRLQILQNSGG